MIKNWTVVRPGNETSVNLGGIRCRKKLDSEKGLEHATARHLHQDKIMSALPKITPGSNVLIDMGGWVCLDSGESRILKRGVPVCTSSPYLAKRTKAREARMVEGSTRKIFDFRPSKIFSGAVLG